MPHDINNLTDPHKKCFCYSNVFDSTAKCLGFTVNCKQRHQTILLEIVSRWFFMSTFPSCSFYGERSINCLEEQYTSETKHKCLQDTSQIFSVCMSPFQIGHELWTAISTFILCFTAYTIVSHPWLDELTIFQQRKDFEIKVLKKRTSLPQRSPKMTLFRGEKKGHSSRRIKGPSFSPIQCRQCCQVFKAATGAK